MKHVVGLCLQDIPVVPLQLVIQLAKRPFGRGNNLAAFAAYLRSHLTAPFRNLEEEREAELADVKRRWKPIPARLRSRRQATSGARP